MSDQSHVVGEEPVAVDPLVGTVIADRYHVEKRLGEGGMGAVYLARHIVLEKQVALKILHGEFSGRKDLVERFLHEAKAAARIRHEHVIDISDFGQTATGNPFFCMEVLFGSDLAQALREQGQLAWPRIKSVFLQTCSALQAAHEKGIIHRDLKPENIFLIERLGHPDFVKVLDFGIAKLTELEESGKRLTKTGMVFGTPEYMSPEQARGDKTDHRVDVYAMGCILFQLLSGDVPFRAETFMGVLTRHLFEPVPPLPARADTPPGLEAVIACALEKDRDKRYATMNDLAYAVEALDQLPGIHYYAPGARPNTGTGAHGALTQQPKTPAAGLVATASAQTRIGMPSGDPSAAPAAAQGTPAPAAPPAQAATPTRQLSGPAATPAVGTQPGVSTESVRSFADPKPKQSPWLWVAIGLAVVGGGAGAAVALSGGRSTTPAAGVVPAPGVAPVLMEKPDATSAAHVAPAAVVAVDAGVAVAAPPDAAVPAVVPPTVTEKPRPKKPPPGTVVPAKPPGTGETKPPPGTPPANPDVPKEPKEKEIKDPFKTGG
jgi:serine/threonine-protein kinase